MQFESLAADLQNWLKTSIEQGHGRDALVQSMRAAGYQRNFAREAVEVALAKFAPAGGAGETAQEEPAPLDTTTILAQSPNSIETSDRKVDILFALNAPRIVLFGGLLSDEECDELITLSRRKLTRSSVVNAETGAYDVHPDRTSSGTHFERGENELIRRIESRIAELVGCPVERGEPIQILHYKPGAEYKPHFDFFDPAYPGNEKVLAMGGQRIATLVMYLNDVVAGGSTVFPEVGLDVLPRRGNAVYFAYTTEDGQLDRRTLHGGSPVAEGEKWIATKWLRQRDYGGPGV
ncbi:2-oxoglutarate-dependent dioxygenase [Betaproteobacteria bacterium PRO7]|nr:2-oxoglutarate-dependent dioxygenase [Betaproteobacteria bacterium PRO7]